MKKEDLNFIYPEDLVAVSPRYPPRVLFHQMKLQCSEKSSMIKNSPHKTDATVEISFQELLSQIFSPGDLLVLNETKVLKRRVFSKENFEILFLKELPSNTWEVLFPAKKIKLNDHIKLPLNVTARLERKGIPQVLRVSQKLDDFYFQEVGELPLPPYIQKARENRHNYISDENDYQTGWALKPGSLAAPTASLHFKNEDINFLRSRGVDVEKITLHVGLGTFLPVQTEDLNDHPMHAEYVEINDSTWKKILDLKEGNGSKSSKIWALGTTVVRSLESQALGYFKKNDDNVWTGETNLLIQPGFQFQVVNALLTNFHQPQSTLLALVAAFAGLKNVKVAYQLAIEKKMKLFSYGDISVWI